MKQQLEETRKTHEQMLRAMESKAKEMGDGREVAQKQVEDMREQC